MIEQTPMLQAVNDNFYRYAGNVILDRAICDARDMLKPSARMLIYAQLGIKNTYDKPFIKSAKVVGNCLGRLYEHGDSSCYSTYMRMAKPFAMRYPIEECQGNSGTVVMLSDEASMRYTELRLSHIGDIITDGLSEEAIGTEWRNNFDDTEQYPSVMPSIGYYNICNGTIGLGIAISSQIPQFNLREVNAALIKLIQNPDADDIIPYPDFATGSILINPDEVLEALRVGSGASCKLRAKIEYDSITHSLHITEVPYSVSTDLIRTQLAQLLEQNPNYGIENFNDNSGKTADIVITLNKNVNAKVMINKLYSDTALESAFPINMWVLDKGRFPVIMGFKQLLEAYIEHARTCQSRIYQHNLEKAQLRTNILDGQ